jgi:hypothetical protein
MRLPIDTGTVKLAAAGPAEPFRTTSIRETQKSLEEAGFSASRRIRIVDQSAVSATVVTAH